MFDDRVEIISPGHLPNNLTVEKIQAGNSNIRNPILVSFVAKGLLPYHGLGSGKTSGKTSGKILSLVQQNPSITIPELSLALGVTERSVERNLHKLQKDGQLQRAGPAKGGYWVVLT